MRVSFRWAARGAALIGVGVSVAAGLLRVSGVSHLGGYEAITLLQAGTTVMVLGCLLYLASLAEQPTS